MATPDDNGERFQLRRTWKEFSRALLRSREPFNPFVWIYRLVSAATHDASTILGIQWRPVIPFLALSLMVAVGACYFGKLRNQVLPPRWCDDAATCCRWIYMHDAVVLYLMSMALYHFTRAWCSSPGILVTEHLKQNAEGCWAKTDESKEGYQPLDQVVDSPTNEDHFHPDPNPSYCDKCESLRPPRCHHCRVCGCCVFQYDHHCVWLNNCVGYSNVRSFLLAVFFITVSCWYGILILYQPFYEPLQDLLRKHGGLLNYISLYGSRSLPQDEKGLFQVPTMNEVSSLLFDDSTSFPAQALVDILFPFLLSVGAIMAFFLGTHVKFVLRAFTTLEHRVVLDRQYSALMDRLAGKLLVEERSVNPFDQGLYRNWTQIMGPSWVALFLPVPITTPPPFRPLQMRKKTH